PASGGQFHRPRQPGRRHPGDGPAWHGHPSGEPRDCIRPCELLLWKPPHPQGCVTDHPGPDHHRHCGALRLRQDHPLQPDRPVLGCGRR
ncbi:PrgI family protein, partial [Dysosmobacter welbionis]